MSKLKLTTWEEHEKELLEKEFITEEEIRESDLRVEEINRTIEEQKDPFYRNENQEALRKAIEDYQEDRNFYEHDLIEK
jgi:predicted metal-dependent phosphoesterase TrpH